MAKKGAKKMEKKDLPAQAGVKKIRVRPLGDRVLVKPEAAEEMTAGGIIIPDTAKSDKPERGIVVALGDGKISDEGRRIPMHVAVGDKVMFGKYGYDEIKIDGEEYLLISESNIVAILK